MIISVTKPKGKPAAMLGRMRIEIVPIHADEGNVDRYLISKRVAVERRTAAGLLRGITDKTLFTSAVYLRAHFAVPVLIVEGQVDYAYTSFDPQAVRGALTSMILQYGMSVLCTPDVQQTVDLLAMMARQEQSGVPPISLVPKRKATHLPDLQRRVVEMLPGSGMVMARALLQYLGSVACVVNATPEALEAVPGIGAKRAAQMHRVLNAEYESLDTERDLEDAIQAEPGLLFSQPVELLARQHCLFVKDRERHVVDMVFSDAQADELLLVELKRGELVAEHVGQIRRYLDHARRSRLLRPHLERGARARGILATPEPSTLKALPPDISVRIVDERRAIGVLKRLRAHRLGVGPSSPSS